MKTATERVLRQAPTEPKAHQARMASLADSERFVGAAMLAPAVLYILLLVAFPFFLALYYSLTNVTLGNRTLVFVGLRNFINVVQTPQFQTALKNTFVFTIFSQVIVVILATTLGLVLHRDFRGKWFVRLLILLPWVAPISLGTIGWLWMLDSIYSVINWTLRAVGIFGPQTWPMWLGVPHLAMGSVIAVHVWRQLPLATIILLAGLSSIPQDIHDAAEVDGAGFWRHLMEITLPLLQPIMTVAILFGVVFTFTDMIVIYVLTRGGPYDTTQVLASLAFFTGVNAGDLGQGAAISLFLFPVLVAAAFIFLRIARRSEIV